MTVDMTPEQALAAARDMALVMAIAEDRHDLLIADEEQEELHPAVPFDICDDSVCVHVRDALSGYTLVSEAELERLRRIEAAATYAFRAMRQQGWHENGAPVMGTAVAKLLAALTPESSNAK